MSFRAAVYGRTSPGCPVSAEQQIEHLKVAAAQHGWTITREFTDRPTSVRRDDRHGESALRRAISEGTLDRVLLLSIDRIGRTSAELVRFLEACRASHVALWLDDQKLDTATANGMSLLDLVRTARETPTANAARANTSGIVGSAEFVDQARQTFGSASKNREGEGAPDGRKGHSRDCEADRRDQPGIGLPNQGADEFSGCGDLERRRRREPNRRRVGWKVVKSCGTGTETGSVKSKRSGRSRFCATSRQPPRRIRSAHQSDDRPVRAPCRQRQSACQPVEVALAVTFVAKSTFGSHSSRNAAKNRGGGCW